MIRLLTVCTGNVCRSPFAATVLADELSAHGVETTSAGVRALRGEGMTPETARLARAFGVPEKLIAGHRARWLDESHLESSDLVLAMTRDHRREAVQLAPARLRSTFTVRELARLSARVSDADAVRVADDAGADPRARLQALLTNLVAVRGEVDPPARPEEDDVVDPYRRSPEVYEQMAQELMPALGETVRLLRIATSAPGFAGG